MGMVCHSIYLMYTHWVCTCVFHFLLSDCRWNCAFNFPCVSGRVIEFCGDLILWPCWTKLLVWECFCYWDSLEFLCSRSCNMQIESCVSSFPMGTHFVSFSCLIVVAGTSCTVLNKSGENILAVVLIFWGKSFKVSSLNMMPAFHRGSVSDWSVCLLLISLGV